MALINYDFRTLGYANPGVSPMVSFKDRKGLNIVRTGKIGGVEFYKNMADIRANILQRK